MCRNFSTPSSSLLHGLGNLAHRDLPSKLEIMITQTIPNSMRASFFPHICSHICRESTCGPTAGVVIAEVELPFSTLALNCSTKLMRKRDQRGSQSYGSLSSAEAEPEAKITESSTRSLTGP
jgi:hypothetical protein